MNNQIQKRISHSKRSSIGYSLAGSSKQKSQSRGAVTVNQSKQRSPINTATRSKQQSSQAPGTSMLQNTWTYRYNKNGSSSTKNVAPSASQKSGQKSMRSNQRSHSRKSSRKRSATPKSGNSNNTRNVRGKNKLPEKIINIKSDISSQHTGKGAVNNVHEDINTLNNTIDFFNELQMGSTIKKAQWVAQEDHEKAVRAVLNPKSQKTDIVQNQFISLTHHGQEIASNFENQNRYQHQDVALNKRIDSSVMIDQQNQSPVIESSVPKLDDFTLSDENNAAKAGFDCSGHPSNQGMLIIQNPNQKNYSPDLNSRNERGQFLPLTQDDQQEGGNTGGQVSASFPHSGTQCTNNPPSNQSSGKFDIQNQTQLNQQQLVDAYMSYQSGIKEAHIHHDTPGMALSSNHPESPIQTYTDDKGQSFLLDSQMQTQSNGAQIDYYQTGDASWPVDRTRTGKLVQIPNSHLMTTQNKPINMMLGYQMNGKSNAQQEYTASHRPVINYYVSSKSSNLGGDFAVNSSSSQLRTNVQHVHSFPVTNMGTITTPTNQNNSGTTSVGVVNAQPQFYTTAPQAARGSTLQEKSAQLLHQFRTAKLKKKAAQNQSGQNLKRTGNSTKLSVDRKEKAGSKKDQRDATRSKSRDRRSQKSLSRISQQDRIKYGNAVNNFQRDSKTRSNKFNNDLKQSYRNTPSCRLNTQNNTTTMLRSTTKSRKSGPNSLSRAIKLTGAKNRYKVQFQDADQQTIPEKLVSKKSTHKTCLQSVSLSKQSKSGLLKERKKSVDSNYKSYRSGSICGKTASLGISSSTKKRSSIGRKSNRSIYSSLKKHPTSNYKNHTERHDSTSQKRSTSVKRGRNKSSIKLRSNSRSGNGNSAKKLVSRTTRNSKKPSQIIQSASGNSVSSNHRRQNILPEQLVSIENDAQQLNQQFGGNFSMDYTNIDYHSVPEQTYDMNAAAGQFQMPQFLNQNSYMTEIQDGVIHTALSSVNMNQPQNPDPRMINNHSTIVNDCNSSKMMNGNDLLSTQPNIYSQTVSQALEPSKTSSRQKRPFNITSSQHSNTRNTRTLIGASQSISKKSLQKSKASASQSAFSIKSKKSKKSEKSRGQQVNSRNHKKIGGENRKESTKKSQRNSQKIMARQQSIGTVSDKSMTVHSSNRKPILKQTGKQHIVHQSASKASFHSRKSFFNEASIQIEAQSAQASGKKRREGTTEKSRKNRKSSINYKREAKDLRHQNKILREKLKITEKYANDIEHHFREQIQALVSSFGANRLPQLNQVDTEGTINRTNESLSNSVVFRSNDMLSQWIQKVTDKEIKAVKEAKRCMLSLAQLQVSYDYILRENDHLLQKIDKLKYLKQYTHSHRRQSRQAKKSKSYAYMDSRDPGFGVGLQNDDDDNSNQYQGSMRSFTVTKKKKKNGDKRSRKASTNTDIFTLFPMSDQNPYDDIVQGLQGKKFSKTVKQEDLQAKQPSPSKSQTVSANRAQVQVYIEACERLEEELEALKASQNLNIDKMKQKNIILMEEVQELKQKLTNSELLIESFKLKKYGEGEEDYEYVQKQNSELRQGRDNFRTKYLEEREARKELEMQLKRVSKECNAKISIIRQSTKADALQEKLIGINNSNTQSLDHLRQLAQASNGDDFDDPNYLMNAQTTGRQKNSQPTDHSLSMDNFNDRETPKPLN